MNKTLLIGLDAFCWEYIEPLLEAGRLPNLERLISSGSTGRLRSVMPPITPVAWSSLITGVNPGKHGVFEWVQRGAADYQFLPVSARHRSGTPVWRRLNAAGIRTGVVNIPLTHPVEPVDGFLLCGFSAPPGRHDLAYPPEAFDQIEAKFGPYHPDVKMPDEGHWSAEAYQAEREFQGRQVRIAAHLAETYQVQVLIINLMLLDHANHTMPDFQTVEQAIVETDGDLGFLLSEFAPDQVMVISDHGSRRVEGVFLLGVWLAENGFLTRAARSPKDQGQVINYLLKQWRNGERSLVSRVQDRLLREFLLHAPSALTHPIWSGLEKAIPLSKVNVKTTDRFLPDNTRAFTPGSHRGNLSLNRAGREPQGIVKDGEKEALLDELTGMLKEVLDPETLEPVFTEIHRPQDLYTGPFVERAPDLTGDYYSSRWSIVSNLPGLHRRPWRYFVTGERWYGDHSRDGIYIFSGAHFRQQSQRGFAHLLDIPATLLYLHGVPQPEDYDGKPMQDTLLEGFVESHPLQYQPVDEQDTGREADTALKTPGEEEILQRLRALGYLE